LSRARNGFQWPHNSYVLAKAGDAELFCGNYEQAQQYYQKSIEIHSTRGNLIGLGYIYWKKGQLDEAQKLFNQVRILCRKRLEQGNESPSVPYNIAAIYAIQGKKKEAYKWLKKAIDAGGLYFRYQSRDPMLENLHEDEQFKQMIAEVKEMVYEMRKRIEKND